MSEELEVDPMSKASLVARRDEGQILALFAGSFLVLLIVVGLVVDSGFAFVQRRDAQNISDLTTVAGTKVVADNYIKAVGGVGARTSADVYAAIDSIAQKNGCTTARGCTWTGDFVNASQTSIGSVTNVAAALPTGTLGVRVGVHWPASTFFIGPVSQMLGMGSGFGIWDVRTTATGMVTDSTQYAPAGLLLPVGLYGVSSQSFSPGQTYTITDASLNTPGNFGWLTWNGAQNEPTLETSVCTPNNPGFTLPAYILGSTGAKNGGGVSNSGINACLDNYLNNQTEVLIPVYDNVSGQGANTQYHIIGVVAMKIVEVNWAPSVKSIKGYFEQVYMFAPGAIPPGAGATAPAPGAKFYYLGLVH